MQVYLTNSKIEKKNEMNFLINHFVQLLDTYTIKKSLCKNKTATPTLQMNLEKRLNFKQVLEVRLWQISGTSRGGSCGKLREIFAVDKIIWRRCRLAHVTRIWNSGKRPAAAVLSQHLGGPTASSDTQVGWIAEAAPGADRVIFPRRAHAVTFIPRRRHHLGVLKGFLG